MCGDKTVEPPVDTWNMSRDGARYREVAPQSHLTLRNHWEVGFTVLYTRVKGRRG